MKYIYIITLALALLLFSCKEKTIENSKYNNLIIELTQSYTSLDSNHAIASTIDVDSIVMIMKKANEKYNAIKKIYHSDTIDIKFEQIMMIVRGQLYKRNKSFKSNYNKVEVEYTKTNKQYKTLKSNLIHEMPNEEEAIKYTDSEKNAIFLLNGEIKKLIETANSTFSKYQILDAQMDSIILVHDTK